MTQCDFFIVDTDEARLVEWIVSNEGCLVPGLDYVQPTYAEVKSLNEYTDFKAKTTLFFVMHQSFYRCPLEIRKYSTGPKSGKFFLVQRHGGPALTLLVPRIYEEEGVRFLPPGIVAYYRTFRNLNNGEKEETPKELVNFFRDVVRVVREGAEARTVASRTYWVSRAAMEEFRKGSLRPGLDIGI